MNLKLHGLYGWKWQYAGYTWHTDYDGTGLWCNRVLVDREFKAPRDRVKMIKLLSGGFIK